MSEKDIGKTQGACLAQEGKYLTFGLGREEYGVEILKVREIIGMMDVTFVPQVPAYVKGVINLRGKVIPVISLRLKFGMPEIEVTDETCIIVINIEETLIGVEIDSVKEVLDITQKDIEPPPQFGTSVNTDYILGMGKVGDHVKILLNIDKVLSEDLAVAEEVKTQ